MSNLALGIVILILILSVRTLFSHLQSWQLREYRWDRMRGYLRTKQGLWNIINIWFFRGILPRPKFTGRIMLIIILFAGINFVLAFLPWTLQVHDILVDGKFFLWQYILQWVPISSSELAIITGFLCAERLIWLTCAIAVFISSIPVSIERKNTFQKVAIMMKRSDPEIIRIGIAGSFGKSSTKNMLVHLLQEKFGTQNVLYTPENLNQEYSIARMILRNEAFFKKSESHAKKFFVFETAAYACGEIKLIAEVVKPQYSLLTGLNSQHLETFGSLENTKKAKTELAAETLKKSFFNNDNQLMREGMAAVKTKSQKIPVSIEQASNIEALEDRTTFEYKGKNITIPWPGKFFVINALLCLNFLEEFKTPAKISMVTDDSFDRLPSQDKALKTEIHPQGFTLYKDLYSQNPDGTLEAIKHLGQFNGKKIFVGMPFLELARNTHIAHEAMFQSLNTIGATVYWTKEDYKILGKEVLGERFHMADDVTIKKHMESWDENTAVLLEGRLPENIIKFF